MQNFGLDIETRENMLIQLEQITYNISGINDPSPSAQVRIGRKAPMTFPCLRQSDDLHGIAQHLK